MEQKPLEKSEGAFASDWRFFRYRLDYVCPVTCSSNCVDDFDSCVYQDAWSSKILNKQYHNSRTIWPIWCNKTFRQIVRRLHPIVQSCARVREVVSEGNDTSKKNLENTREIRFPRCIEPRSCWAVRTRRKHVRGCKRAARNAKKQFKSSVATFVETLLVLVPGSGRKRSRGHV